MKIITDHVPRDIIHDFELSPEERAEFDYIDWPAIDQGNDSAEFFRFKGKLYDTSQFLRAENIDGWDGYSADSFFSGLVVRYVEDGEFIVVGSYLA